MSVLSWFFANLFIDFDCCEVNKLDNHENKD